MKILTYSSREATFKLCGVDIGDYIEAEFRAPLGQVGQIEPDPASNFPFGSMKVYGYSMLLTFWCDEASPQPVEFRTLSRHHEKLFAGYGFGSKLVMTPTPIINGSHTGPYAWNALTVNRRTGISPAAPWNQK